MFDDTALDILAVHRLTRLATKDSITSPWRSRLIAAAYGSPDAARREADHEEDWHRKLALDDNPPKLAELLTCRWCMSVWIAGAVMLVRHTRPWRVLRYLLALSSASTLLAQIED